eukprot:1459938-Prymnesium_polylepis.1
MSFSSHASQNHFPGGTSSSGGSQQKQISVSSSSQRSGDADKSAVLAVKIVLLPPAPLAGPEAG